VSAMVDVELAGATTEERAALLALMQEDLKDILDLVTKVMGITWPEFVKLYESRGEVRTIKTAGAAVGYLWVEHRNRELHIHAIFVLAGQRGKGIGSAALIALEKEFAGRADALELGVKQTNSGAQRLYRRHGFAVERELADLGFLVMRKPL
jgi:ribosomal protein S18 acetylase RimI-like enzyme